MFFKAQKGRNEFKKKTQGRWIQKKNTGSFTQREFSKKEIWKKEGTGRDGEERKGGTKREGGLKNEMR